MHLALKLVFGPEGQIPKQLFLCDDIFFFFSEIEKKRLKSRKESYKCHSRMSLISRSLFQRDVLCYLFTCNLFNDPFSVI
jgi:hypothetical protein